MQQPSMLRLEGLGTLPLDQLSSRRHASTMALLAAPQGNQSSNACSDWMLPAPAPAGLCCHLIPGVWPVVVTHWRSPAGHRPASPVLLAVSSLRPTPRVSPRPWTSDPHHPASSRVAPAPWGSGWGSGPASGRGHQHQQAGAPPYPPPLSVFSGSSLLFFAGGVPVAFRN